MVAQIRLWDEDRDVLRAFAEQHGPDMTQLLAAWIETLPPPDIPTEKLRPAWRDLITRALAIKAERRRR